MDGTVSARGLSAMHHFGTVQHLFIGSNESIGSMALPKV
jgi:hypothetical protein